VFRFGRQCRQTPAGVFSNDRTPVMRQTVNISVSFYSALKIVIDCDVLTDENDPIVSESGQNSDKVIVVNHNILIIT
jgi:hypothetical protein